MHWFINPFISTVLFGTVVSQQRFTLRFFIWAEAGRKWTVNRSCTFQPESKNCLKLVKISTKIAWRSMASTKLEELHPVEILILVFLVVLEAIITLCTVTPKLWKSKDSATISASTKLSTCSKTSTNAPEESQPQSTSTLSAPVKQASASVSTRTRSTRFVSSRKNKQSGPQKNSTSSGATMIVTPLTQNSSPAWE